MFGLMFVNKCKSYSIGGDDKVLFTLRGHDSMMPISYRGKGLCLRKGVLS